MFKAGVTSGVMIQVRNRPGVRQSILRLKINHLIGPAEVEVLADHLLEEQAPVDGLGEHLGQGELGLQDRDVVAVAGLAACTGERMRQQAQPLAQKAVDLFCRQVVADLLQSRPSGAAEHPRRRAIPSTDSVA
jgi:hypothetical protein